MALAPVAIKVVGRLVGIKGKPDENQAAATVNESTLAAANAGDWRRVETIAGGGTTDLPYPNHDHASGWTAPINWSTGGRGTERQQERAFAADLIAQRNQQLAARTSAAPAPLVARVTGAIAPVLLPAPALPVTATVTTNRGTTPAPATISARTSSARPTARPTGTLAPRPASQPSTLDTVLTAIARLAPGTAPVISALAPSALPVNVSVTAPAAAPVTPGGASPDAPAGFLSTYGVPLALGGAGLGLVLLLMRKGRR